MSTPGRPFLTAPRFLPLVGAAPPSVLRGLEVPERLLRRYGIEAPMVVSLADGDQSLLRPLADGVAATQEVIVPPDAGANVQVTLRRRQVI